MNSFDPSADKTHHFQERKASIKPSGGATAAISGGLAGMVAKTATNPLERIKLLSQTGENGMKSASISDLYRGIIRNEGVVGLWAGNGANLVRVFPSKAVVFSTNDMYHEIFRKASGLQEGDKLPLFFTFIAGGFAGMTACAFTYPLDFAQGRISGKLASHGDRNEYRGIIRTIAMTVKDEGFRAIYKGVTPTVMGSLPYEGIKFGTVGFLEQCFPVEETTPTRKMLFGGIGGVVAGLIAYPNDTIRRLLQLQGSRGSIANYSGYWDCVQQTYNSGGIARFYRGFTINVIRMGPNVAVQFGCYELLKNATKRYNNF